MKYKTIYTKKALRELKKLPLKQARAVVKKISYYTHQKQPSHFAKKLKHPAFGEYRFRIGDFRVIFEVDKKGKIHILYILIIKHLRNIYRNL